MKALNDSIPKQVYDVIVTGNINEDKLMKREHKRMSRGRSFLDFTKTKGAFGNRPNKTIPEGYDFTFPKKEKHAKV